MPEYILPLSDYQRRNRESEWNRLDAFTQGYIEALFFTENTPGWSYDDIAARPEEWREAREAREASELPEDSGFEDLALEALDEIKADCALFQRDNAKLLAQAYACVGGYGEAAAGRDFWYTRNGHGVGFWDRGLGQVGDDLAALCGWRTSFAEINPYLGDDGLVYLA